MPRHRIQQRNLSADAAREGAIRFSSGRTEIFERPEGSYLSNDTGDGGTRCLCVCVASGSALQPCEGCQDSKPDPKPDPIPNPALKLEAALRQAINPFAKGVGAADEIMARERAREQSRTELHRKPRGAFLRRADRPARIHDDERPSATVWLTQRKTIEP